MILGLYSTWLLPITFFQPKSLLAALIPPRLRVSVSAYQLLYQVFHRRIILACCDMAATSAPVAGSDFGRKLVGDAFWPPFRPSQHVAPELTVASFIFLVFLHKMKYWKMQLIRHKVITPWPLASMKWAQNQEKRLISPIPKRFLMLISCVCVLAILKRSHFLRRPLSDLCFPGFGMFTLTVLSWWWFIHAFFFFFLLVSLYLKILNNRKARKQASEGTGTV